VARSHGDEAQSDQILFRWIDASPTDREVLRAMQDHRLAAAKGDSEGQLYALNGRRLTIAPCGG
jgi:hypothetical protein